MKLFYIVYRCSFETVHHGINWNRIINYAVTQLDRSLGEIQDINLAQLVKINRIRSKKSFKKYLSSAFLRNCYHSYELRHDHLQ